jgi:hypothetical protein
MNHQRKKPKLDCITEGDHKSPEVTQESDLSKTHRKKKIKKKKKVPAKASKTRDFSTNLLDYLLAWEAAHNIKNEVNKNTEDGWKFSKVMQSWALSHCFEASQVPSTTFKLLLEYFRG